MSHLAQLTIESQGLVSHDTTTTHHALQWTVEKEGVTVHFVKVKGHMDKYEFLRLLQRLQTLHHGLRPREILTTLCDAKGLTNGAGLSDSQRG